MPTASPTPPVDVLGALGDFFFGNWLGQAITAAAVVALLVGFLKPLRQWLQRQRRAALNLIRDVRLTRKTTIERNIQEAVTSAVESVRAELSPPDEPWSAQKTEEEQQALRDEAVHRANMRDQWSISTNRSRMHGFVLHNHAARTARKVRLDGAKGFEFLEDPNWDEIDQGKYGHFHGRVIDAQMWEWTDRRVYVHWIDDHGDAQVKRIQVDRRISATDYMLGYE